MEVKQMRSAPKSTNWSAKLHTHKKKIMTSSTPILSAAYDQLKDESHELLKKKKGLGKAIDTVVDVVKAPGAVKKELKKLK
jgi:hypothetical protein